MLHPLDVRPDNIWQYAQNKPSLICRDLEDLADVPQEVTAKVLMARGVYKWLAVRRDLILLKDEWKDELTRLYRAIENREVVRNSPEHHRMVGRMKALEECRAQVRELCHSERWRCPDIDEMPECLVKR